MMAAVETTEVVNEDEDLQGQVEALKEEVTRLREEVARLREKIEIPAATADDDGEREVARAAFVAQLAAVGGADRAGQQVDALFEACWNAARPHSAVVVGQAASITAQWAMEKGRAGGRAPGWSRVAAYVPKVCRTLAEEEADRVALVDDDERLFVRLVGPKPRDEGVLKKREWEGELRDFRKDRELYLWSKCGRGGWPRVVQRARDLGLWDDDLLDRVSERLRSGYYD